VIAAVGISAPVSGRIDSPAPLNAQNWILPCLGLLLYECDRREEPAPAVKQRVECLQGLEIVYAKGIRNVGIEVGGEGAIADQGAVPILLRQHILPHRKAALPLYRPV